jgi:dolichol-phosphate mannosyltransferase
VGASGVFVNLAVFWASILTGLAASFSPDQVAQFKLAQAIATGVAATSNFFLNNLLTYRDKRLRGWAILRGLFSFLAISAVGALVSISFAGEVLQWFPEPMRGGKYVLTFASLCGIAVGTLLNFSATAIFTWQKK